MSTWWNIENKKQNAWVYDEMLKKQKLFDWEKLDHWIGKIIFGEDVRLSERSLCQPKKNESEKRKMMHVGWITCWRKWHTQTMGWKADHWTEGQTDDGIRNWCKRMMMKHKVLSHAKKKANQWQHVEHSKTHDAHDRHMDESCGKLTDMTKTIRSLMKGTCAGNQQLGGSWQCPTDNNCHDLRFRWFMEMN